MAEVLDGEGPLWILSVDGFLLVRNDRFGFLLSEAVAKHQ